MLYQPLTLLDCLHTFCGSCLKEWFSFEANQAKASKPNPFTCPSCRASVRETRPDAKVTTLLEMFVQANPGQGRTDEEKAELAKRYTVGDNVLPKVKTKKESREEAADRRMVEEARDQSLRDVGIRGLASSSHERGTRHRARESLDSTRATVGAHDTRSDRSRRRENIMAAPDTARAQARQIEHQSSLRSLLSSSSMDSTDMEEEILRQIMEDGILDGIDLSNIDGSQEDELSEKIAEAYRRRHGRQRSRDNRGERSRRVSDREHVSSQQERPPRAREGRSSQTSDIPTTHSSHPPLSRPHLLEAYPAESVDSRRRTTSETRRQTSPDPRGGSRAPLDTRRQAARSATDISTRAQRSSDDTRARPGEYSRQGRRTTDPDGLHPRRASHGTEVQRPVVSRSPNGHGQNSSSNPPPSGPGPIVGSAPTSPPLTSTMGPRPTLNGNQHVSDIRNTSVPSPRTVATQAVSTLEPTQLYPEPSISCNRCGKANIEYELHENCGICNDGNYDLCLRCYRLGRGCLHWIGFGHAAFERHRRAALANGPATSGSIPHRLKGHRYMPPPPQSRPAPHNNLSYSDPTSRLQSGPFCSNCSTYTPDCFWRCDVCNEGEWGFCNSCVNVGDCCTHPLLPLALSSYLAADKAKTNVSTPVQRPTSTVFTPAPSTSPNISAHNKEGVRPLTLLNEDEYTTLHTSTKCDICTHPIPPSTTRFHCPHCNSGDYDICTSCYLRLLKRGAITADNGPNGWRRCPRGHRMIVVGFEDAESGQRRVIDKDLVGGRALKDEKNGAQQLPQQQQQQQKSGAGSEEWRWQEQGQGRRAKAVRAAGAAAPASSASASASTTSLLASSSSPPSSNDNNNNNIQTDPSQQQQQPSITQSKPTYPPNGGLGLHVLALWSYWPSDSVTDELAFPKGAEIREVEDINGDWFWGVYCGRRGLFPGNYARVLMQRT